MHRLNALAAAALAAMSGLAGTAAHAQQTSTELQTITVTAERRTENVQQVPNSVSVVPSELLDVLNTSGQDVRMLSGRVPSLNIESSFGRAFPRFYIRGYGNTDFRLNASQPVSLVYDDVVQENPILKGFPAFDLARVEVLRGPQGSLFGRNTPAGVVKFESNRPVKGKFEGYGSLSGGTFSTINLEGAINVPTSSDSALRVSLMNQTRDDWVDNTFAAGPTKELEGYRDSALRAQWLVAEQGLEHPGQRARARLRRLGASVPRQHHQPGHQRLRPRLRREEDLDRRQERERPGELRCQSARALGAVADAVAELDHRL